MNPVHLVVLVQHLVVLGNGRDEDHRGHLVEAVDPLLALVALAAHVEHGEVNAVDQIVLLLDPCGAHARAQNVRVRGRVPALRDAVDVVHVIL